MSTGGTEGRVVGTYDVPDDQFARSHHHEGFNQAFNRALSQIDGEDGDELDARIEFEATIRVYTDAAGADPGGVGQYRVIVTY